MQITVMQKKKKKKKKKKDNPWLSETQLISLSSCGGMKLLCLLAMSEPDCSNEVTSTQMYITGMKHFSECVLSAAKRFMGKTGQQVKPTLSSLFFFSEIGTFF